MMKHPKNLSRLDGKTVIVTGASDGIGVETARYLADLGATLVLPARNAAKADAVREDLVRTTGNKNVTVMPLDLASLASVRRFVEAFTAAHKTLDVLVLNAGVSPTQRALTVDGFETTMGVNHFAHFALTLGLLPLLRAAGRARIVVVSSKLHLRGDIRFDDMTYEKSFGSMMSGPYPDSKLANALFAVELAKRLEGTGVSVNYLHPGVVSTALARDMNAVVRWFAKTFFITPEKGAQTSAYVAASPDVEGVSGRYFDECREAKPSPKVNDAALRARLWELSEKLTGVRFEA